MGVSFDLASREKLVVMRRVMRWLRAWALPADGPGLESELPLAAGPWQVLELMVGGSFSETVKLRSGEGTLG